LVLFSFHRKKGIIICENTGETFKCEEIGDQAMKILEAGGIKNMMGKQLKEETG
jgi:predicted Fe-Mo cluster-binding NifX family protein